MKSLGTSTIKPRPAVAPIMWRPLAAPRCATAGRGFVAACLLLTAVGCTGLGLPKAVTQDGITKQRTQRNDEARQYFERQHEQAKVIDAAESGEKTDSNDPDDSQAFTDSSALELLHVGQAALAEGAVEAAREYFRQAVAARPDDPQVPISAAVAALRANRPELAVELLAPAAERFPKSAAVHRALGAAYYRGGDYKSSQLALRKALSLDKSNALSYLLMGYTLAKLGQDTAAESHLRQARAMDPRYNVSR